MCVCTSILTNMSVDVDEQLHGGVPHPAAGVPHQSGQVRDRRAQLQLCGAVTMEGQHRVYYLLSRYVGEGAGGRGAGDYTYCSSSACTQRRASSRACGALCCSAGARRASSARQFTARYAANDVTHVRAVCRTASFVSANLWARNITL